MLIESLSISNFRQFYGDVSLHFSTDTNQNITVVHGANGSGKTSLLNAFKWCFYGETDFDTQNENILNEAAIQAQSLGSLIDLAISVKFRHEGRGYDAIRKQRYKRVSNTLAEPVEKSKFTLDVTGDDGQTKRSQLPYVELCAILPQDLQPYFFFNGERIEHIAGINQGLQIREAIRKLMGLELVDRAVDHVDKVKRQYRKAVREGVSEEQKNLHDLVEAQEQDVKRYEDAVVKYKRQEELAKGELSRISRELKQFEKSRDLQEKRDDLELQTDHNRAEISRIRVVQKRLISENGFLVISAKMFDRCDSLVDKNRKKGVLPYGIKEQFIDDRIKLGTCICGTKIDKGSAEHTCLLEVRSTAGSDDLESSYTSVSALLKSHEEVVERYKRDYVEESHRLKEYSSKNARIRNEIDEISAQLTQLDDKKIASLENEHSKQVGERDMAMREGGSASNSKDDATSKLEEHNMLLERLNEQKSKQDSASLRMGKAAELVVILTSLRESLSNQVRIDLSKRVDEVFQSIIRKPVRAVIDEEYRLQVLKTASNGEEYPVQEQSTGERQVTSLSFISSIISLAKEKHAKKGMFFQGGLYPLVMDSPFGALDDDYREKVAAGVSELAEQVIMFVSNSQWSGRVKKACSAKVGKSYQLIYHSPNLKQGQENEYTVHSENEFEYTKLLEVSE